jgi:hypothetical protein
MLVLGSTHLAITSSIAMSQAGPSPNSLNEHLKNSWFQLLSRLQSVYFLRAGQILERDVRTEDIVTVISDTFAASVVDMLGNIAISSRARPACFKLCCFWLIFATSPFRIPTGTMAVLTLMCHSFLQPFQTNPRDSAFTRQRTLYSTRFPVYYSRLTNHEKNQNLRYRRHRQANVLKFHRAISRVNGELKKQCFGYLFCLHHQDRTPISETLIFSSIFTWLTASENSLWKLHNLYGWINEHRTRCNGRNAFQNYCSVAAYK